MSGETIRRTVVVGVGGVGGVLAGNLASSGHEVLLVEKDPEHRAAIDRNGLRLRDLTENRILKLPVVAKPGEIGFRQGDAAVIAVKAWDTEEAVAALAQAAGRSLPVFMAQNGVRNDEIAARFFDDVNGIVVIFNGKRMVPGVVVQTLDGPNEIGSYPHGLRPSAQAMLDLFAKTKLKVGSTHALQVARWNKLLLNLSNPTMALLGLASHEARSLPEVRTWMGEVYAEGERVLRAAGIQYTEEGKTSGYETRLQQVSDMNYMPAGPSDEELVGYVSMSQDLMRRYGRSEAPYLMGEIVRLGKKCGVPTPYSSVLLELVNDAAEGRKGVGTHTLPELRQLVKQRSEVDV